MEDLQALVGNITKDDLRYFKYYSNKNLCISIPSEGCLRHAIKRNHTHPSYSFAIFNSIEDNFLCEDKINIKENHYAGVIISPYLPHEEFIEDRFIRYISIFIDRDYFEKEYSLYNKSYIEIFNKKVIHVNKDIMIYIKEFMKESKSNLSGRDNILDGLTKILVNRLIREIIGVKKVNKKVNQKIDIDKAIEYMHNNFGRKIVDKELALISNLGESYFINVFKKEMGMTPKEYLNKLRIEKAKKILDTEDATVKEIAEICGYSSASYFSNCFKKEMGVSPSDYKVKINK